MPDVMEYRSHNDFIEYVLDFLLIDWVIRPLAKVVQQRMGQVACADTV